MFGNRRRPDTEAGCDSVGNGAAHDVRGIRFRLRGHSDGFDVAPQYIAGAPPVAALAELHSPLAFGAPHRGRNRDGSSTEGSSAVTEEETIERAITASSTAQAAPHIPSAADTARSAVPNAF